LKSFNNHCCCHFHSLAFSRYHVLVITQCTAFSDYFLSLTDMQLSVLHIFHYSFLFSIDNIQLSECITVYLTIHLQKGHLDCFQVWAMMYKDTATSMCKVLCGCVFSSFG
jgi:hypothetical protein